MGWLCSSTDGMREVAGRFAAEAFPEPKKIDRWSSDPGHEQPRALFTLEGNPRQWYEIEGEPPCRWTVTSKHNTRKATESRPEVPSGVVNRKHVSCLRRVIETHPHLGLRGEQLLDELADPLDDRLDAETPEPCRELLNGLFGELVNEMLEDRGDIPL